MQSVDVELIPAPGVWSDNAACLTLVDADIFTGPTKPLPDELAVAARVCRHCPVRQECAAYADRWATYGVWAGRWFNRPAQSAAS